MVNTYFSVVIPTYNNKEYLKKAIQSVLSQSFNEYEIIIVDNFSNDGTEKLVSEINEKKINIKDIINLTNLSENHSITNLVDNCLAKNKKKTSYILNENNYSNEDSIIIIRTFLIKAKRLLKLTTETKKNKNLDFVISSFKPPIFWKEKEIIKTQLKNWTTDTVEKLIHEINQVELLIKKNSQSSLNILSDFILKNTKINN
tara:strand:+ start:210 stop:812 length:603 start_codon:yes stop_codon:yes gene_type:complete